MMPYLVLKALWMSGVNVGLNDASLLEDPATAVMNDITAGLEVAAVGVALALTHRWGQRLPAWTLVAPLWLGMGLLVPRILLVPLSLLLSATAATDSPAPATPVIDPWVLVVVPLSFLLQAVMLAVAFVLYARTRWGRLLGARPGSFAPGVTGRFQTTVAAAAGVLFAVAFAVRGAGVVVQTAADVRPAAAVLLGMNVLWAVLAVGGLLAVAGGRLARRTRIWVPLTVTWLGSGSLFAWGALDVIAVLAPSKVFGDSGSPLIRVGTLVCVCVALVVAVVAGFAVLERNADLERDAAQD